MVIIGFGTSAPEMLISAFAAWQGNPGIALGNAYGSNIANIALILGLTAVITPIAVHSTVLRKELPVLTAVTVLAAWQLYDGLITRFEALILLVLFAGLMIWAILQATHRQHDALGSEMEQALAADTLPFRQALAWLLVSLVVLLVSSRMIVWGAVQTALQFGVSDLIIGLTIIAIGTSLPELASSIAAIRKGQHDIALGNVLGSNLFNTLAVVGIAAGIHPMTVEPEVLSRDLPVMAVLTLSLFVIGFGFRKPGRINRIEGSTLLVCYIGYTSWLIYTVIPRMALVG